MVTTLYNPKIALAMAVDVVAGRLAAHVKNSVDMQPTVGTGAGQVAKAVDTDVVVADNATPKDYDLTAITDAGNDVVAFTAVTHVMFVNKSATESVTIGGGANPLFPTDPTPVPPGDVWFRTFAAGLTVDATHKTLRFSVAAGAAVPGVLTVWGK